jgi:hypothetical protein
MIGGASVEATGFNPYRKKKVKQQVESMSHI